MKKFTLGMASLAIAGILTGCSQTTEAQMESCRATHPLTARRFRRQSPRKLSACRRGRQYWDHSSDQGRGSTYGTFWGGCDSPRRRLSSASRRMVVSSRPRRTGRFRPNGMGTTLRDPVNLGGDVRRCRRHTHFDRP